MRRVSVHFKRWKLIHLIFGHSNFLSKKKSRKWIQLLGFQNSRHVGVFFIFAKFQRVNEAEQARRHNVQKSYTKQQEQCQIWESGTNRLCFIFRWWRSLRVSSATFLKSYLLTTSLSSPLSPKPPGKERRFEWHFRRAFSTEVRRYKNKKRWLKGIFAGVLHIIKCFALPDINQDMTPVRRTSTLLITAIHEERGGKTLFALLELDKK